MSNFPLFFGVTRTFDHSHIRDVAGDLTRQLDAYAQNAPDLRDKTVALCVGSRGIASLPVLVKTVIDFVKSRGGKPYIVPAMGSHGGAKAESQKELLANLGITEEAMGAPIRPDMATTEFGPIPEGPTVRFATEALKADFVLPIVRVKEHTVLYGDLQSGLCKMLVIGCGKQVGAKDYHKYDISQTLEPSAKVILQKVTFYCGVAVVENAYDQICVIRVVKPEKFIETDRELLKIAKTTLPKLPFKELDALIINEIGKDISGAGADLNVTGKWRREGGPRVPDYKLIATLGVTPASHGNATGIGFTDIMPSRILDILDYNAMRVNALTSGIYLAIRLPMHVEDDRVLLQVIVDRAPDIKKMTIARIRNTMALQRFWVTEHTLSMLTSDMNCVVDQNPQECKFDDRNIWLPFD